MKKKEEKPSPSPPKTKGAGDRREPPKPPSIAIETEADFPSPKIHFCVSFPCPVCAGMDYVFYKRVKLPRF